MTDPRAPAPPADSLAALSETECRRLLGTRALGRVGMTSGGLPCILPVCYEYDDGAIMFRTGFGAKLRAAASGDVLAFEVDDYDPQTGQGWSVMVLGRASVATNGGHDDLANLDGPDDGRGHLVRLHCEMVSGRVIEAAR
jgi:nitroimidazol reductase NimA-like FMN-containing flavoprotein (pyridoxamine 5'-phosphate oxidase superfamily)